MKPMPARGRESFLRDLILGELASDNCLIDSREVLKNDAACAQIQMTDFRVAHLAFGEADI